MRRKLVVFIVLLNVFCFSITSYSNAAFTNTLAKNDTNNIKQATLIEKYIINYKSKIEELEKTYEINNSEILKENYYELDKMIWALRKIKTKDIDKNIADQIIKEVVRKLKIINSNLKLYIELKERDYKKRLNKALISYNNLANRISSNIKDLIKKMVIILKRKDTSNPKYKKIIIHLSNLEKESKNLDKFENGKYESISEIKFNLVQSIKNIRKELVWIKSLLK